MEPMPSPTHHKPKIAKMIRAYGAVIEKEAQAYGFICIVMDGDFKKQLQKAIKLL